MMSAPKRIRIRPIPDAKASSCSILLDPLIGFRHREPLSSLMSVASLSLNTGRARIRYFMSSEKIGGCLFTAEIGFEKIVFTFKHGVESERHEVRPADIQSVSVESDGSTKLRIRLHRDLTVPSTLAESVTLKNALERVLEEVKEAELRMKEAARELRVEIATKGVHDTNILPERDYEKSPDD